MVVHIIQIFAYLLGAVFLSSAELGDLGVIGYTIRSRAT